jgi:glutamate-1-semialdehyde 2,1-aminomutase
MAAGIATLDAIAAVPNAYSQLETRGRQLADGLIQAAAATRVPATVNRVGSMLTTFFTDRPVTDYASAKTADTKRYADFFRGMLERGVYLAPSQFEAAFISLALTEEDIAATIRFAAETLNSLGK